jgi:hypothetical protein
VPEQLAVAEELLPVVPDQLEDCGVFGQGGGGQNPTVGAKLATRSVAIADTAKPPETVAE